MSDEQIQIIKVPALTFEFGDKRFRALYGPENEKGGRPLAGLIEEQYVSALETVLEAGDAAQQAKP